MAKTQWSFGQTECNMVKGSSKWKFFRQTVSGCSYSWIRDYTTFSILNSAENKICLTNEYKKKKEFKLLTSKTGLSTKFAHVMNVKTLTIVGILLFITRRN